MESLEGRKMFCYDHTGSFTDPLQIGDPAPQAIAHASTKRIKGSSLGTGYTSSTSSTSSSSSSSLLASQPLLAVVNGSTAGAAANTFSATLACRPAGPAPTSMLSPEVVHR